MKFAQWAGWIIALIFIFLYYKSCQAPKQVVTTSKGDSILVHVIEKDKQDSINAEKFFNLYSFWRNKYDSLYSSFAIKEQQVISSAGKVKNLSDSIRYYKKINDTLKELTTIGDLLDEDSVLLEILAQAKIQIDSLQTVHTGEQSAADSTIFEMSKEIFNLKSALFQLHTEYSAVVADENKMIKKVKTNSIWAKVTTITTAILSSILILKK